MLTLLMRDVPAGALDLVRAEFAALPGQTYGGIDLGQVATGTLEAGVHFRVFEAGIDLGSGELRVERSQHKGSGLLVRDGQRLIAAIFLATDSSGKSATRVQQTSFGPFAEHFAQAVREVEGTVAYGEFEPRLLRVSSLSIELLWLSARDGSGDLFVPILPVPEFMTYKHYTKATLAAALASHLAALIDGAADGGTGDTAHEP